MKKNILWLALLFCSLQLQAQTESIQRVNIKSPEVAAFTKVGEVPVSFYTGVPQISIPIYEVKCGKLRLPITLDYQATAIQVNQESTWVGLNWLLNAGGVVTTQTTKPEAGTLKKDWEFLYNSLNLRTVNTDGLGRFYKMDGNHESGWRGSYGYNRFKCIPYPKTTDISFALYAQMLDNHEGEAQSYTADFMGQHIEFIYHPLQEKFIVTGKGPIVKIAGGATGISKITDADGIEYTFGITETNSPDSYTTAPYAKRNVSYYLTQIKHPDGKTIRLSYKQYGSIRMLPELQEYWHHGLTNTVDYKVEKQLSDLVKINNYYLYEITTDEETVRFNAGTRTDLMGGRKLESIEIRNKADQLFKRFRFTYDYFAGNGVGGNRLREYYESRNLLTNYNSLYSDAEVNNRLRLVSLQEETMVGSTLKKLPAHQFTYQGGLPGKSSSARDYWGHYNGQSNKTLLPPLSLAGETGYNNFPYSLPMQTAIRRCNPSTITAGMLSKIIYPTGGESSFSYEPHSFTNYIYLKLNQTLSQKPLSVYAMTSNCNSTIPAVNTEPKDFTIENEMLVEITVQHSCPEELSWRDMLGSPAMLMVYDPHLSSTAKHPYKTWTISPADTLRTEGGKIKDVVKRVERIMLPAGKYQLYPNISSPQITPYPSFPGDKRVEMWVKSTNSFMSQGGGVRIKEIRQTDGNGNTIVSQYDYTQESGMSSGLMMYPLRFSRNKLQVYQAEAGPGHSEGGSSIDPVPPAAVLKNYWSVRSESMASVRGTLVGYSRVTLTRGNGKQVYEFWNKNDKNSSFDFYPPFDDPRNGNLLREAVYSSNGNLQRETENTYSVLKKEHHFVNALVEDIHSGAEGCSGSGVSNKYAQSCGGGRVLFCIYPSSRFWIECTNRIAKEYTDKGVLTTEYRYTYNPWNLQPSVVQTIYDSSLSETVHMLYPQNYAGNGYPQTLVDNHILNVPTETVKVTDRAGTSTVTAGELYRYNEKGLLTSHSRLKLSAPLAVGSFKFSNKSIGVIGTDTLTRGIYSPSADYSADASCTYTSGGNLSTITEKQTLTTVYLWSYNKQHVIAEIANTTYAKVKEALGYTDAQMTTLENSAAPDVASVRSKLDTYYKGTASQVTTYTWSPFVGITSVTGPNGNITRYSYDTFGRLQSVTDHEGKTVQAYEYNYKNQ